MINVNQITAQMARMPDAALQHYAQMNKSDPYIVSLALSESNRRKEIRGSADMSAQPQPKVVDQSIAEMNQRPQPQQMPQGQAQPMPEHVGIGQLPAPNIQDMAEGGVVGYSDGGSVMRFQSQGLVPPVKLPPYTATNPNALFNEFLRNIGISTSEFANSAPATQKNIMDMFQSSNAPAAPNAPAGAAPTPPAPPAAGAAPAANTGRFYSAGRAAGAAVSDLALPAAAIYTGGKGLSDLTTNYLSRLSPEQREQLTADVGSDTPLAAAIMNAAKPEAPPPNAPSAAPAAPAGQGGQGGQQTPPAPAADTGADQNGIQTLVAPAIPRAPAARTADELRRSLSKFMPSEKVTDPFAADTEELGKMGIAAAEQNKALREKQISELGLAGLDQEKRLKEREGKLGKAEGENTSLALMKAGFAMMSGTSQYAAANIGKGAEAGMEDYVKGREKIDVARERLDDAFDKLNQVRRGELIMNQKERAQLDKDVNTAKTQAKQLTLEGAKQAYGMARKEGETLFNAYETGLTHEMDNRSRENIAQAGYAAQVGIANQRTKLMQDLYGGDVKAQAEFGKIQKQVMADLAKNPAYSMESNEAKRSAMYNAELNRAIQSNPFLAARAAGLGFQKAPTGPVRDLMEQQ